MPRLASALSDEGKLLLLIPDEKQNVAKPIVAVGWNEMASPQGIGVLMPLTCTEPQAQFARQHYAKLREQMPATSIRLDTIPAPPQDHTTG